MPKKDPRRILCGTIFQSAELFYEYGGLREDSRPESRPTEFVTWTTDGKIVSLNKVKCGWAISEVDKFRTFVIPAEACGILSKIPGPIDLRFYELNFTVTDVSVEDVDVEIKGRIYEGEAPNLYMVLPKEPVGIALHREGWEQMLEKTAAIAKMSTGPRINNENLIMHFKDSQLFYEIEAFEVGKVEGSFSQLYPLGEGGDPVEKLEGPFAYGHGYLSKIFANLPDGIIDLQFGGWNKPSLFQYTNGFALIMPINIQRPEPKSFNGISEVTVRDMENSDNTEDNTEDTEGASS